MVAPLFILPHIVHLLGTDNLQSGFKCKQIMVAPISILSHIVPYCSPLSLKFPRKVLEFKVLDSSRIIPATLTFYTSNMSPVLDINN